MTSTEYLTDLWAGLQSTYHYTVRLDNPPEPLVKRCRERFDEVLHIAQHYMHFGCVAKVPLLSGRILVVEAVGYDGGKYVKITEQQSK